MFPLHTSPHQAHSIRRHSSFDQSSSLNRVQSSGSFREKLFSTGSKPEELNTVNVSVEVV